MKSYLVPILAAAALLTVAAYLPPSPASIAATPQQATTGALSQGETAQGKTTHEATATAETAARTDARRSPSDVRDPRDEGSARAGN